MSDQIPPEQMEQIAQRAADIVLTKIQAEIGKVTIRSFLYILGLAALAILSWLGYKNVIRL
jgi:hypothetical protein